MSKQAIEILAANEHFVAVNKPSGVLSIPDREQSSPSMKQLLNEMEGRKVFTVHRLDRDTSGLLIFAKDEATHKFLSRQFEDRSMEKYYLGLVHGQLLNESGSMDGAILEHPTIRGMMVINRRGKASLTDYQLLEVLGPYSLVQFRIHTGRTHQIRVHMKDLGHSIVGDELYGDGKPVFLSSIKKQFKLSKTAEEEQPILSRLALHAWKLKFTDEQGTVHEIEAPLPKDMRALIQQLRKWKGKK